MKLVFEKIEKHGIISMVMNSSMFKQLITEATERSVQKHMNDKDFITHLSFEVIKNIQKEKD